ncbi:hypothetical protein [Mycolicibacterium nivoides]|uniref:hypothetical protein n=1 Tax=Mycolicibacterium nivoides TaxID=2487344 RepID=UPI000F5BB00C|nr:hypothetical protein [Mycolicibacterium nivoides]
MNDDTCGRRRPIGATRILAVLAACAGAAAMALALTSCGAGDHDGDRSQGNATTTAGMTPTRIVNEIAVDSSGRPANGYRESADAVPDRAAECDEPSPAAVSDNIYGCAPSAYAADVCWPAADLDLLCMNDPWAKEVHRIHVAAPLAPVTAPVAPQPVALLLDDGTHCRLRNGGSWGGRDDGYVGAYRCDANQVALTRVDSEPIDRSTSSWTVELGDLPGFGQPAQPPAAHSVVTAWFAGK